MQTEHQTLTAWPARGVYTVMAFLLTCLFFVAPLQLSARTNQSIPRQIEEETHREECHESRVKAPKLASSWRKAQRRSLSPTARRVLLTAFDESEIHVSECWEAHTHRHRGPPSLPFQS